MPEAHRYPLGSPELARRAAAFVGSLVQADPARFDGVGFVFAERYTAAPPGCEGWHLRIEGRNVTAGAGVPDDADIVVVADHAVASRIGSIVYGADPAAKARANSIAAEAAAAGKLKVELRNLERAMKAGLPADALHDALAPHVLPPAEAAPDASSSRWVVHRGQRIHYTVHGSGPLVVLQHGALASAQDWAMTGFVAGLADRFAVASVDSLAHGRSDKPADPALYDLRSRAGDLVAVIDDLGEQRAHVVGYSMGGWMASGMALHFPERLASLTIAGWDVVSGLATAAKSHGIEAVTFDWLMATARTSNPELTAWVTPELEPALRAAVEASADVSGTADAVARLSVPVLLWNGEGDPYHEPMRELARKHGFAYLVTPGDHVMTFALHGAEAARGVRKFLLGG